MSSTRIHATIAAAAFVAAVGGVLTVAVTASPNRTPQGVISDIPAVPVALAAPRTTIAPQAPTGAAAATVAATSPTTEAASAAGAPTAATPPTPEASTPAQPTPTTPAPRVTVTTPPATTPPTTAAPVTTPPTTAAPRPYCQMTATGSGTVTVTSNLPADSIHVGVEGGDTPGQTIAGTTNSSGSFTASFQMPAAGSQMTASAVLDSPSASCSTRFTAA